jgi:hypothetical protein
MQSFTTAEIQKLEQALDMANKVLLSDSFKGSVSAARFTSTNDNGVEVYQRLMSKDWEVPFAIQSYSRWQFWKWREVANEDESGLVTFNRKFFTTQSIPSLVNTVVHETCHVAGYSHRSATDYNSVPYQVGSIAEEVAGSL